MRLPSAARWLLALCLASCASWRWGPAPEPPTRLYSVVIEGRIVGTMSTADLSPGVHKTFFTYRDRERGPNLRMQLSLDAALLPASVEVTGTDEDENPLAETFARQRGAGAWKSPVDEGTSRDAAAFYVPVSPVPEVLAHLARALLRTEGGQLRLLAGGEARISRLGSTEILGPRSRHVVQYAVDGLQFGPSIVWLEEDGTFFASGAPLLATVLKGYEAALPGLFKAQSEALLERERALAKELGERAEAGVAIVGATLVDVRSGLARPGTTVVVQGAWIVAVGPDGKVEIPSGARRVEANGRALLPGLWDMHVHPESMGGLLHLAAGVTTVRDCGSSIGESIGRRALVARGEVLGPRLLLDGLIDGQGGDVAPTEVLVDTPAQARAAVDRYASLKYDQVKIYYSVAPPLVPIIAARAHEHGLRLSGHVPRGMTAEQAVRDGLDEIHHAYFLFPSLLADKLVDHPEPMQLLAREAPRLELGGQRVQEMISLFRSRQVIVDPTLALCETLYTGRPRKPSPALGQVLDRLPPQIRRRLALGGAPVDKGLDRELRSYFEATVRLTGALYRGGVRVVAGSDSVGGFTLHRELELLVQAGLQPAEVLRLATLGAAELMKRDREVGAVEVGKRADLILVDGDPLQDISAVRRVSLVMKDGILMDSERLYRAIGVAK